MAVITLDEEGFKIDLGDDLRAVFDGNFLRLIYEDKSSVSLTQDNWVILLSFMTACEVMSSGGNANRREQPI